MKHWIYHILDTIYTIYEVLKKQQDWFYNFNSYFALLKDSSLNLMKFLTNFKKQYSMIHTTILIS